MTDKKKGKRFIWKVVLGKGKKEKGTSRNLLSKESYYNHHEIYTWKL